MGNQGYTHREGEVYFKSLMFFLRRLVDRALERRDSFSANTINFPESASWPPYFEAKGVHYGLSMITDALSSVLNADPRLFDSLPIVIGRCKILIENFDFSNSPAADYGAEGLERLAAIRTRLLLLIDEKDPDALRKASLDGWI